MGMTSAPVSQAILEDPRTTMCSVPSHKMVQVLDDVNRVEHVVSCWASLPDGHYCSTDEPVSDNAIINHAFKTYKGSASYKALSFRKLSLRVRWRAAHSVRSTSYFSLTRIYDLAKLMDMPD